MNNAAESVCIVLAGGLGTRLRPVVGDRPKCLAPVGKRTFLALQLEMLATRGIQRFVLSLGHLAPLVQQAIEPMRARLRIDAVTEPEPLGTGGAILYAMQRADVGECMVTNGDTWLDTDLSGLLAPLNPAAHEKLRMGCSGCGRGQRAGGRLPAQGCRRQRADQRRLLSGAPQRARRLGCRQQVLTRAGRAPGSRRGRRRERDPARRRLHRHRRARRLPALLRAPRLKTARR